MGETAERQVLWGGETAKAVDNFPVSGERIPVAVAHWLGRIKAAAARANAELGLLDPHLAYLTGGRAVPTPFATTYAIRERLPYDVRALRRWVADRQVGRLEIKQRGTTVDPAKLRRALRPTGPNAATLIVSRTPRGTVVLVAERVDG